MKSKRSRFYSLRGCIFDITGSYYFAFLLGVAAVIMATVSAIPAKKPERG